MKKIIITLFTALLIAAIVFLVSKNETDMKGYSLLVGAIALIFIVPLMKFLLPVTRELKIGTSEFYPNLFHKTAEYFKKKRSSR
ncbi:hypothetical protein ACQWU4_12555 [Chryseobacterium sp. MIQD13]|uniref:hypothetical protein n=1 Tax=Chryseobacterium sp. MIQD13 TaxID=3422310 RepID=UPI003D2928C7